MKRIKPICIIDTTSIVILTHFIIEDLILGNQPISEALTSNFYFVVPNFLITDEIEGAIRNHKEVYDVEIPDNYLSIYDKIDISEYNNCLNVVRKWIELNKIYIKQDKDEGEIQCMALSLYLSRKTKEDIFVISDDKKARRKMLDCFINSQKIGYSMSFPDLLLYLFNRNKNISKVHVEKLFQEYYHIMPAKVNDEIKKTYRTWLKYSCRVMGIESGLCSLTCL